MSSCYERCKCDNNEKKKAQNIFPSKIKQFDFLLENFYLGGTSLSYIAQSTTITPKILLVKSNNPVELT